MQKITIAIDGYSSTGKSTIAKQLAKALGYLYVDTGAMYRAVTLFALRNGFVGGEQENLHALVKLLPKIRLKFVYNEKLGYSEMYMNDENVEKEIRNLEISQNVSRVAEIEEVRHMLVDRQKKMGMHKGIVMDGRDIGTVVFPNAELKIFMNASPEKRAQSRDHIDSTREFSPLRKAHDAIEFDNSDMGLKEQFERMYHYALRVIENKKTGII